MSTDGVREVHGRDVQATDEPYLLPADAEEASRLDTQHATLKLKLGGLYPAKDDVERILKDQKGEAKRAILDVGTGSGAWAIDMAEKFPDAEVIGVDLAPVIPGKAVPENCRFEIGNAEDGFSKYPDGFNLIQCRALNFGIKDWDSLMHHVYKSLRPGGIVIVLGSIGLNLLHEDGREVANEESYLRKIMDAATEASIARNPGFKDQLRAFDVLSEMKGWTKVHKETFFVPTGSWDPEVHPKEAEIARLMNMNVGRAIPALRPLILVHGYPAKDVDAWVAGAVVEITKPTVQYKNEWYSIWAVKAEENVE